VKFDCIPVTRFEQNCSVVRCEKTQAAAVIDPGGDLHLILDLLEWQELRLEVILVTHGHFDHCGAAAALAEKTGARIEGPHAGDAHLIAGLPAAGEKYGVRSRSYQPARWLEHGDSIRFGAEELQALHCPGHTRGHMAYFHRRERQAFVGDILFRGAIGAWEHREGDLPLLLASIRGKLFTLGDDVGFVPGHGEFSTMGRERRENPFVGDEAIARWRAGKALHGPADPAADRS
jgi:glyoxylase-like metal-dependent hydrolase (beta-lactamase superfamily II)